MVVTQLDFKVNVREVAEKIGQVSDDLATKINSAVQSLSISTHAFVTRYANEKLDGFKRSHFFGDNNQNVRWAEVAPNIWVVEIDPSVAWIEEGREPTSMATDKWLLKPGAKGVKTAKDGSTYRVIPFTHSANSKDSNPQLASQLREELRGQGISMSRIAKDQFGKPKLGVVEKLNINKKRSKYPDGLFSEPRSKETANQVGLKSHHGHHLLNNAVVVQREEKGPKGKSRIRRDVVTYRVVSSKHKGEGRWMYPKVEPLNSIPEAFKYAEAEWEKIVQTIEEGYRLD